jgi:hypothetical protein
MWNVVFLIKGGNKPIKDSNKLMEDGKNYPDSSKSASAKYGKYEQN